MKLRPYQQEGVNFIRAKKRVGLFFTPGLGKTLTTLSAITPEMLPALIVAPLRVARYVWPDEITKHGFVYSHEFVHGKNKTSKITSDTDIKIVNPEGLPFVVEHCRTLGQVPWRSVIVDESSMFKNCTSKRWKHLRAIIDKVDYRILLTGTPTPNHLGEIWAQMAILDVNVFPRYQDFMREHFHFDPWGNPTLKRNHDIQIHRAVMPHVLHKDARDELDDLPDMVVIDERVELPKTSLKFYEDVDAGIEPVGIDSYLPLRTLASGFVYKADPFTDTKQPVWHHNAKIDRLAEIIEENDGEQILVFFGFRAEGDYLRSLEHCRVIDGASSAKSDDVAIQQWNSKQLRVLGMHPRSGGHGLNLQISGARRIVWLTLPDSGELWQQANARLWRSGQRGTTIVHRILAEKTIDHAIAGLLRKKKLTQAALLQSLKDR